MNNSLKGFLSENHVAHELMARDFEVYKPLVDIYGCDFVVYKNGVSSKIQVRSASGARHGGYRFNTLHGSYCDIPYENGMVDFFILHLIDIDSYYIIPFDDINSNYILISLNSKNKYYSYKEAWNLLEE